MATEVLKGRDAKVELCTESTFDDLNMVAMGYVQSFTITRNVTVERKRGIGDTEVRSYKHGDIDVNWNLNMLYFLETVTNDFTNTMPYDIVDLTKPDADGATPVFSMRLRTKDGKAYVLNYCKITNVNVNAGGNQDDLNVSANGFAKSMSVEDVAWE